MIRPDEFLFEPGMTVKKDFFIENDSTGTVYYRLYFAGVSGDLADVLEVTVKDGNKTLYSGTPLSWRTRRRRTICWRWVSGGH